MSVSPEVKAAVDEIRKDRDLISSMRKADELRDKQLSDLQDKINALQTDQHLSDEDKQALQDAVSDAQTTSDGLASAVVANTDKPASGGNGSGPAAQVGGNEGRDTNAEPINSPAGGPVPLMPTLAFDPDPTGVGRAAGDGQPNQPKAIETAGGFVVAGGGSTHRAPGSDPTSPSSTLVVPLDPDARAAQSNADVIKSGLGDSSQNALLGNDGQPIEDGPGIVQPASEAKQEAIQKQQDALNAEMEKRRENPLNLAEPGTPQAGSAEADKAAQERRQKEQADAVAKAQTDKSAEANTGTDGDPNQKPNLP